GMKVSTSVSALLPSWSVWVEPAEQEAVAGFGFPNQKRNPLVPYPKTAGTEQNTDDAADKEGQCRPRRRSRRVQHGSPAPGCSVRAVSSFMGDVVEEKMAAFLSETKIFV
ncbi:hypothetical protein H1C71_035165, partial [Ictidomys tridecemlineatus]